MAQEARQVLLVDDDAELCNLLREIVNGPDLVLESVHDGEAGLAAARAGRFDLVILDIMLPKLDGLQVLRRLRASSDVPIIMLTARNGSADRISGLELGADDYVPKPFEPRELIARMRAILRRSQRPRAAVIELHPVRIDVAQRRVWKDGAEVELTSVEFDILELLMRRAGSVVSRALLTDRLYGRMPSGFDRTIDVHICHLRQKLESGAPIIRTVRAIGYQYCVSEFPVSAK